MIFKEKGRVAVACANVDTGEIMISINGRSAIVDYHTARWLVSAISGACDYPRELFDDWVPPAKDTE